MKLSEIVIIFALLHVLYHAYHFRNTQWIVDIPRNLACKRFIHHYRMNGVWDAKFSIFWIPIIIYFQTMRKEKEVRNYNSTILRLLVVFRILR